MFRPNSDTLRGILGLPGQNQNERLHKTDRCNVLLLLGSLYRHLAAISGGDRRQGLPVDKIRNLEDKKVLIK